MLQSHLTLVLIQSSNGLTYSPMTSAFVFHAVYLLTNHNNYQVEYWTCSQKTSNSEIKTQCYFFHTYIILPSYQHLCVLWTYFSRANLSFSWCIHFLGKTVVTVLSWVLQTETASSHTDCRSSRFRKSYWGHFILNEPLQGIFGIDRNALQPARARRDVSTTECERVWASHRLRFELHTASL